MDPRKLAFLQAVVGPDGAQALVKAARTPDLEWAIFPRVVMSWIEAVGQTDYLDNLPGIDDTRLTLRKNEFDYSGSINIGDDVYTFRNASVYHVAGSVAVALGSEHSPRPPLSHPALPKLGKSIDLLVKARILRKAQNQHHGGARGASLPGQAAAPQAPLAPIPPTPTAPKPTGMEVGTKVGGIAQTASKSPEAGAKPKLPGVKPSGIKLPGQKPAAKPAVKMKVTKAESTNPCPTCATAQFKNDQYVACLCFRDLAKSTKTTITFDGAYLIEFGPAWDHEAINALAQNIGK